MVNKLRSLREAQGMTQEQLAVQAGVSRQSIISIEKGHYVPTTVLALKLAGILKTTVHHLFELEKSDWE